MDFGLKELGITFMVGAFTILGAEALLYFFFGKELTGFFRRPLGFGESGDDGGPDGVRKKVPPVTAAVFIALAFAIGIVAEDLSYKYVDTVEFPFDTIPTLIIPERVIIKSDLPSHHDSRVKTLIKDPGGASQPKDLAVELARAGAFTASDPKNGPAVERWMITPGDCRPGATETGFCPSLKTVSSSILRLYYLAKNKAYAEANYYDEMKKIQMRLEFSRSITLLSAGYLYFALSISVVLLIKLLLRKGSKVRSGLASFKELIVVLLSNPSTPVPVDPDKQIPAGESSPSDLAKPSWKLRLKAPAAVMAVLFGVHFISAWAYGRESEEFNKRAFGYFATMMLDKKQSNSSQAKGPRQTPIIDQY